MMANQYYYLIASLPMIHNEGKPPLSVKEFLSICQRQLMLQDYQVLETLLTEDDPQSNSHNATIHQWINFNREFRNEIAFFRAKRANRDPKQYLRGERSTALGLIEVVNQASRANDPLAAEKVLDRAKWEFLDALNFGHYFDIDVVIIYGIKLKMLERLSKVASQEGQDIFEQFKKVNIPEVSLA